MASRPTSLNAFEMSVEITAHGSAGSAAWRWRYPGVPRAISRFDHLQTLRWTLRLF